MAAKKIRKRAYIPPSHEVVNRKERAVSTATKATRASARRTSSARGGARGAAYEYPQPSFRRTLRRLPIYFVMIFALQYFLPSEGARDSSDAKRLFMAFVLALAITIVFAPFMHVMDRMAYNRWLKRSGRNEG